LRFGCGLGVVLAAGSTVWRDDPQGHSPPIHHNRRVTDHWDATEATKSRSPFFPGQPVPVEFFVGRAKQADRLLRRGAQQVAAGKPTAFFVEGDYGIGKSSLVTYAQRLAEDDFGLLPVYVTLGGCKTIEDVAARVVEATLSSATNDKAGDKLREWLARYVGEQQLFGFRINLQALRADAPNFSSPQGMLRFFRDALAKVADSGVTGFFLVLDEVNGIAGDPTFSIFLKSFVDENGVTGSPVPMLLTVCGTEDKRREMIARHQPVDRVFDVVHVDPMTRAETDEFFSRAFRSARIEVADEAFPLLWAYSAGLPKIMQMLGDNAFWMDRDGTVTMDDVSEAVVATAEEVGRKFVDQQVYNELRGDHYQAILDVIGQKDPFERTFSRSEIMATLTEPQKKVFDNFLRRMTQLQVIRKGGRAGEYEFNVLMVRFYIHIAARRRIASGG